MLAKGTLVWVTPHSKSEEFVDRHGALWIVDSIAMRGDLPTPSWYWCRAMADGYLFDWRADELTIVKEEQDK